MGSIPSQGDWFLESQQLSDVLFSSHWNGNTARGDVVWCPFVHKNDMCQLHGHSTYSLFFQIGTPLSCLDRDHTYFFHLSFPMLLVWSVSERIFHSVSLFDHHIALPFPKHHVWYLWVSIRQISEVCLIQKPYRVSLKKDYKHTVQMWLERLSTLKAAQALAARREYNELPPQSD